MLKVYDISKKVTNVFICVTYAVLLLAALFITFSVVMRYVFKNPLLGSVEVIEVAMSAMVFASLAWTQTQKGHIHITMVLNILPERLAIAIFAVCELLATGVAAVVCYALFQQGIYAVSINYVTAMTAIPYSPFYFFASLCMALFAAVLMLDTIIAFGGVFNEEYRRFVLKSW